MHGAQTRPYNLCSQPKEFFGEGGGMESEPMLTPREEILLPESERRIEPATLHHTGQ